MNYNYEKELRANGIPCGRVFIIDGRQGAGKTSLAVAMFIGDYSYFNDTRIAAAVAHYKVIGLKLSALPDNEALHTHLYYSNVPIALSGKLKKKPILTHYVTADDICMPDGEHPATYFPWGSVIFLQEASDRWHSHDWQKLSQNIRLWLKYLRQANLTLILDTHNDSDIAKQLRELATDELYVDGHYFKPARFFGLIKARSTWYFNWSYPQSIRAAERRGEDVRQFSQNVSYRIKGNIYDAYDSYGAEALFLRGVYNYGFSVKSHPIADYTSAEGIENYCINNSFITKEDVSSEDSDTN